MAIERKYSDLELVQTYSSIDYASWVTHTYTGDGKKYKVSPVIMASNHIYNGIAGTEFNHLKITVNYSSGDSTVARIGIYKSNSTNYDTILDYYASWNVGTVSDGVENGFHAISATWKEMDFAWIMIADPGDGSVNIDNIEFRSWVGHDTLFGHEIDGAGEFWYYGVKLNYGISYPKNYDSNYAKRYPLCISTPGDGTAGCGDNKQFRYLVQWGSYLAGKWYNTEKYEAISVVYQMPYTNASCLSNLQPPYSLDDYNYAYNDSHLGTWLPDAINAFIEYFISNPNYSVDTDKIYTSGFSRGAIQSWVIASKSYYWLASFVTCYESRSFHPTINVALWVSGVIPIFLSGDEFYNNVDSWNVSLNYFKKLNIFRFYETSYYWDHRNHVWPNGFEGTWIDLENNYWEKSLENENLSHNSSIVSYYTDGDHNSTQSTAYGTELWMDQIFNSSKTYDNIRQNIEMSELSDHAIVIYRQGDSDSESLADYYLSKYDLDGSHKVSVPCSNNEILDNQSTFYKEIEDPLKVSIHNLDFGVNVIVLSMNVPTGFINGSSIISSTSRLSRINHPYIEKEDNPIYNRQKIPTTISILESCVITSSLDAPTLDLAKTMIDQGITTKNQLYFNGRFFLDPYSDIVSIEAEKYRDELLHFYENVLPDTWTEYTSTIFTDPYFDPVIPYLQHDSMFWGWFTDRSTDTFFRDTDSQRIFFYNADYDGGLDIRNINSEKWCALAIRGKYGACAGSMSDPTIDGFLRPTPFIRGLQQELTIGEAYLLSSPYLNWTITLFGDPLTYIDFRYGTGPEQEIDEHEAWRLSTISLAKSIGSYYKIKDESELIKNEIVASSDVQTEVDLLLSSVSLAKSNDETNIISTFSNLSGQLLRYPPKTFLLPGYVNNISLEQYLELKEYKISRLLTNTAGLESLGNDGVDLPNRFLFDKGYWEYEYIIVNETPGVYSLYNFELEISTDSDFSNIVRTIDSNESKSSWFYEYEFNKYNNMPTEGVSSSFIGLTVAYKSRSTQYLTRGNIYYFRVRQKTNTQVFNWTSTREVIWT